MQTNVNVFLTKEERQALEAGVLVVHTAGKAEEEMADREMCPEYAVLLLPDRRISLASSRWPRVRDE